MLLVVASEEVNLTSLLVKLKFSIFSYI